MTTISKENTLVTLINIFRVEPENQEKLVRMLLDATEGTMRALPGFVSANIHRSLDGTRVTNYAQWRTRDDFEAMLANPEATERMDKVAKIATCEAHLYEVVEGIAAGSKKMATSHGW